MYYLTRFMSSLKDELIDEIRGFFSGIFEKIL
jgi:hypothetical protein